MVKTVLRAPKYGGTLVTMQGNKQRMNLQRKRDLTLGMAEQSLVKRRKGDGREGEGKGTETILDVIMMTNFHRLNFFWVMHSSFQIKMVTKISKKTKTKQEKTIQNKSPSAFLLVFNIIDCIQCMRISPHQKFFHHWRIIFLKQHRTAKRAPLPLEY